MERSKEQVQLIGQMVEETRLLSSREACIIHAFLVFSTPPDSSYKVSQDGFWPLLINSQEFPPDEDGSHNIPVEEVERLKKAVEHILVNEISNLPDWDVTPFFDGTYLVRRGSKLKKPNPRETINGMSLQELRAYLDDEQNDEEVCALIAKIICSLFDDSIQVDYTELIMDPDVDFPIVSGILYYANWGEGLSKQDFIELEQWCRTRFDIGNS